MSRVPLDLFAGKQRSSLKANGGSAYRRPPFFHTKKLALLGSTASLELAPWHDPSWTLAAHPCCRPRCQREPDWYFDMHRPECFRAELKSWNPQYYTWLKKLQTPIFMQENWPDIPMSVRYPKERIFAEFRAYFTNHCAYMIALAMTEGVTHIGLFGCQYAGAERGTQRDSLTYWLGRFEQSGGVVVIPSEHNTLLTKELYGYESHDEEGKLIPSYRVQPVIENKKDAPVVLVEPSTVPLMPPPEGTKPRRFEDAFPQLATGARSPREDFAGCPV
jgi:hypothetical protein